jgi:REP element-mobilizing transposase RayT
MSYFGEDWDDNDIPLAYLITIRTYGTWLHGDKRSSVDRHEQLNAFGGPKRSSYPKLESRMRSSMKSRLFVFDEIQREVVKEAIEEVAVHRGFTINAINVRTNHAHIVVRATCKPEKVADSFKSYSTRKLRDRGLVSRDQKVWSRGRSRRYLWKGEHLVGAIDYVLYCQGSVTFEEWYESRYT